MARGAYVFVALVYSILAASFVASTATLIMEFKDHDWVSLALAHSHLFIFFPTFGIVVLAAFYRPSVIFTHLYWSQEQAVPFGKLRFLFGLFVAIGASWWVAQQIGSSDLRGYLGDPARGTGARPGRAHDVHGRRWNGIDMSPRTVSEGARRYSDVRPQTRRLRRIHSQLQSGSAARAADSSTRNGGTASPPARCSTRGNAATCRSALPTKSGICKPIPACARAPRSSISTSCRSRSSSSSSWSSLRRCWPSGGGGSTCSIPTTCPPSNGASSSVASPC